MIERDRGAGLYVVWKCTAIEWHSLVWRKSTDKLHPIGLIKASELFEHVVRGTNQTGRSYRHK